MYIYCIHSDHKQDLEEAIISETSGHFKRLLVSMLTVSHIIHSECCIVSVTYPPSTIQAGREEEGPVNMEKAKKDAQVSLHSNPCCISCEMCSLLVVRILCIVPCMSVLSCFHHVNITHSLVCIVVCLLH